MPKLPFSQKLVLNQWLISLFGINPLEYGRPVDEKPFDRLVIDLRNAQEGIDSDGHHHFYHVLKDSGFFLYKRAGITEAELQSYEEDVVAHTAAINARRPQDRQIRWKYFQWLSLIFSEAYLDRYFRDRAALLADLNNFVTEFNARYSDYQPIAEYKEDDLNKVCLQNATGSGKTLLMHVNLKQFWFYAKKANMDGTINFPFLITPNSGLSAQHRNELAASGISGIPFTKGAGGELGEFLYTLEIQKIQKEDGPETFAVRNFGDNNLLFVDEGHAGLSGDEDATWMGYRAQLCEKGFSFEYSATFEQAVSGTSHEDEYAKAVLFDYSYKWFYKDGYGKDYQIYNIPKTFSTTEFVYLTGCLLKYYQQLRIYEERKVGFAGFNLEKPLWVFVGSTVSGVKRDKKTKRARFEGENVIAASDVAQILAFIGEFLSSETKATQTIADLLLKSGVQTGMLDANGNDFFEGAFEYLAQEMQGDTKKVAEFYKDILRRVFNGSAPGKLQVERLKGNSGEILLRAPLSEEQRPFGLINVGSPKELCDHLKTLPCLAENIVFAEDSDISDAIFQTVRESSSPINLLIGSKKFVEGWDCWRVSTLGLMHVGRSEGAQIIQLFGRGVRLKGWNWSLKRSNHSNAPVHPNWIQELELLNVFGIQADFMQRFKGYLESEGLPGNEKRHFEKIPLNVTYDFGKKLKVIRPKKKASDGKEYDFKRDAPVPSFEADIPNYIKDNKVVLDYYPRVQRISSEKQEGEVEKKNKAHFGTVQLGLVDWTELYLSIERFKRERTWYNLDVTENGLKNVLSSADWYELYIPEAFLRPTTFAGVRLVRDVAAELLKRYAEKLYRYSKQIFIEPRLEYRDLTEDDDNMPKTDEYIFSVDADDATLINQIQSLKKDLADKKDKLIVGYGVANAINFGVHLFQPLFRLKKQGKVEIVPLSLNESEFQFVVDLYNYTKAHKEEIQGKGQEIFLLRNLSRGKGMGFAEASNFHPDFILWVIQGEKQYITFVEPHGMMHEDAESDKVRFCNKIKGIEKRLGDANMILNSFILTPTPYNGITWMPRPLQTWIEEYKHILFLEEGGEKYLPKLFGMMEQVDMGAVSVDIAMGEKSSSNP